MDSIGESSLVSIPTSLAVVLITKYCMDRMSDKPKGITIVFSATVASIELYKITTEYFDLYYKGNATLYC
jgi:hypothetical protein